MIERQTIGGRSATIAYFDDGFAPVSKVAASLVKLKFDDGEMMILRRAGGFVKENPYHDPETGEFTSGPGGVSIGGKISADDHLKAINGLAQEGVASLRAGAQTSVNRNEFEAAVDRLANDRSVTNAQLKGIVAGFTHGTGVVLENTRGKMIAQIRQDHLRQLRFENKIKVEKFNENHDELGRFSSGSGGGMRQVGGQRVASQTRAIQARQWIESGAGKEALSSAADKALAAVKNPEHIKEALARAVVFTLYHGVGMDMPNDIEEAVREQIHNLADHASILPLMARDLMRGTVQRLIDMRQKQFDGRLGKDDTPIGEGDDGDPVLDRLREILDALDDYEPDDESVSKKELKTLFVKRRLLNAGAIRAWAVSQGIPSALSAGDMHVTVAFSKEPVDWSLVEPLQDTIVVGDDVEKFNPNHDELGRFTSGDGGGSVVAFHGAVDSVVEEIRRDGFQSLKSMQAAGKGGGGREYGDFRDHAVYVASTAGDARGYADMRLGENTVGKAVIFELRIPKDAWRAFNEDTKHWAAGRAAYTHKTIPPEWIVGSKVYSHRAVGGKLIKGQFEGHVTAFVVVLVSEIEKMNPNHDELGRFASGDVTVYHGTTKAVVASILKNGLIPGHGIGGYALTDFSNQVFTATTYAEAMRWAKSKTHGAGGKIIDVPVILKITIPEKEFKGTKPRTKDVKHGVLTFRRPIKPEWITIVKDGLEKAAGDLIFYAALVVRDGVVTKRDVHQFPPRNTPNGALVLRFASADLHQRWQEFRDAGASWDFPEYQPHITITYSVPEADVSKIEPYRGPLIFGPEEFAEVDEGWAGEVVEERKPR